MLEIKNETRQLEFSQGLTGIRWNKYKG